MLKITGSRGLDLPCNFFADDYIPLKFTTYASPIGARHFRLGNFQTSLLEIAIDPLTWTVCGLTIVSFDMILPVAKDYQAKSARQQMGLPCVDPGCCPDAINDEQRQFGVDLRDEIFIVDWNQESFISYQIRYENIIFNISRGELTSVIFENLSNEIKASLSAHLARL